MKLFSTFSGIGGFELGIIKAYESVLNRHQTPEDEQKSSEDIRGGVFYSDEQYVQRTPTCVGFSEIDKYASAIYQSHFPNHKNYGDITKINAEELPDFDLLVGGFPCQAFSIAGKRKGFDDTRGTLFFDLARILRAKRPRLFVFENVKGLLSHDNGKTFATIISTLDDLGYDLQWQVLNSKNHGVPQNRERIIIVGHLRGTPRPEVFPFGEADGAINARLESENTEVASTLRSRYGNGTGSHIKIREATKRGYAEARIGDSINYGIPNSKTRRGRVGGGIAQTLDTGMQQATLMPDMRIRRLTPTECERLQGFPDGWTEGVSDTQRYKTLGNAVTVNVIRDIMIRIIMSCGETLKDDCSTSSASVPRR